MFRLYPIAEEGGEDDRGAENEQTRPDKGDDRLGDAVLTLFILTYIWNAEMTTKTAATA